MMGSRGWSRYRDGGGQGGDGVKGQGWVDVKWQ